MPIVLLEKLEKIFQNNENIPQLEQRKLFSDVVFNHPESFHACETCNSISHKSVSICPVCTGYSFNSNEGEIIILAIKLGNQEKTCVTEGDFE